MNGEVRESKLGTILLQVESMDQIKILDDEAKTDAEMKLGFRPIKKGVLSEVSETQEPPAKKVIFIFLKHFLVFIIFILQKN